mmetsp:Transcript_117626/g.379665  ORF Transcript_117626/g.379665 Transcript_117626/m.379665 type:complete len:184 (-) Transcript_117626:97-648(-)
MRELKYHEKKLLKKVDFYNWKSDRNIHENAILKKYLINDREDYTKYAKLSGQIISLATHLRKLPASDPDRIKMTEILLEKLYSMGLIKDKQSLQSIIDIPASAFCRRRLPVVLCRLKFCETLAQAATYVQQGHFRIGPDVVSNPALHVTRSMEDHITWAEGSAIKRHIKDFTDQVDDFELLAS